MQLPVTIRRGTSPGQHLRTGEHCTETGWWTPLERGDPRFVTEGSLMPSFEGQPVLWGPRAETDCAATCPTGECRRQAAGHGPTGYQGLPVTQG